MTTRSYRIEWRPMAREDLRAIVQYVGKDNPARAKSFGKALRDKTRPLAQNPELGRHGRLPGIRELVVHPNYVVFYRVLAEGRTVQILRVKHAAQQMPENRKTGKPGTENRGQKTGDRKPGTENRGQITVFC